MSEPPIPETHWRALCACGWIMRGPRDVVGPAAVRHADEGSHAPVRVEEIRHPRPATAATVSFTFDPVQVFPPGDKLTTPLLRLMLAADDVRFTQRLFLETSERLRAATGTQAKLLTGEHWYGLRLLCSHLHEAIDGFRTLTGSVSPDQIKRMLTGQAEALAAFDTLRAGAETDRPTRTQTFIFKARSSIGSHYDNATIERAFAKYAGPYLEGLVTAANVGGLTRFTLTDGLAILLLLDAAGADLPPTITTEAEAAKFRAEVERALEASASEMLPLAGALTTFVDALALTLVQQRGYTERAEATVEVPQMLRAAGETE